MSLATEVYAITGSQFCPGLESRHAIFKINRVITLAAGADIDHGYAQIPGSCERLRQPFLIQGGYLHGKELQPQFLSQCFDGRSGIFPVIQHQMLTHTTNGGQLYAIEPRQLDSTQSLLNRKRFEQHSIDAKIQHNNTPFPEFSHSRQFPA